jgi:hypothetical protein
MNSADDPLRSFGMSGFMITDDLKQVESRFNIELGHVPRTAAENPADYYPQFEQDVRREAAAMSKHYELFYCLEQAIRKLISEAMRDNATADWWNSGKIPAGIVQEVKSRIEKETDSGVTRRSDDSIDYTTFGELSVIITSNWDLFGAIFTSRRAVEKVMNSLNVLRGPIAHCCPLSDDEVDRLHLTVKDWFRIIG